MTYRSELKLPRDVLDRINRALNPETEDDFLETGETILRSVKFPDNMIMDIKCCGSTDGPAWTEAYLLKPVDGELRPCAFTAPSEDYDGEWELSYNDDTYIVNVTADNPA